MVGKKGVERLPLGALSSLMAMSMEMSEVSPELMLVQLRLEGGDGNEADAFGWEELRVELGDVVTAWHMCEEGWFARSQEETLCRAAGSESVYV
jgi:hypothetical protein